jgi:prepilin-type N-terminal cleavage/methylation domain-containing protein
MKSPPGPDSGFTLMETLVSIAIVLIISGCVITAVSLSYRIIIKAKNTSETAATILQIDHFIREQANDFHIPYWENAAGRTAFFKDSLWQSKYGQYIYQIHTIISPQGFTRGISASYSVNGTISQTSALFPSIPVLENVP